MDPGARRRLRPLARQRAYPIGSLAAAGVPVAPSSDNPCGPLDPLANIRLAVHRTLGDGRTVDAREAIAIEKAVATYSVGVFRAIHGREGQGLAAGAPADFVILDRTPLGERSRATETWIGGELAWSAAGKA